MIRIPTLNELYLSIKGDLEASESISIPLIGKSVIRVFAAVQAAKIKLLYLTVGNLQKNIFVDTADPEALGGTLERFGRVKLGRDPFPPRAGQYQCSVIGGVGAVIPANTTYKTNDDSKSPGVLYVLDSEFTFSNVNEMITLRALGAGLVSQLDILDELTITAPVANVEDLATVESVVIEPLDAEDIEEYRRKAVESYRIETQGGATGDYLLWSFDAQGVQRVYPYAKSGFTSEINLYIEATVADSTDDKGTPSAGLIAEVEQVVNLDPDITLDINQRGRRPIGSIVNYLPITVKSVTIEIVDFQNNDAETTAAILATLKNTINSIRPFIAGSDVLEDKNDILDKNKIIGSIISIRPGSIFSSVNLYIDLVSVSTFTFENGDIPSLDGVSYI